MEELRDLLPSVRASYQPSPDIAHSWDKWRNKSTMGIQVEGLSPLLFILMGTVRLHQILDKMKQIPVSSSVRSSICCNTRTPRAV